MADKIDQFLACLMRAELSGDGRPGLAPWPSLWGEEEAQQAWQRICLHGIAYLVAARAGEDWPAGLREPVRRAAREQAFWEISHAQAIGRLLDALAEPAGGRGACALVLKGTALAYALYPDPAARRRGDTDLLVRPEDVRRARAALRACGFVPRINPHGLLFQESWLLDTGIGFVHCVDLHWRLGESPVFGEALDGAACFAAARPLGGAGQLGRNAWMPALVDTFIHGAFNQAWHRAHGYFVEGERLRGPLRLIWLIDNARLIAAMSQEEWEALVGRACRHGFASLCLAALEQTRQALGVAAPERVLAALRLAPQQTALVRRLENPDLLAGFLMDLQALPQWRAKLALALGHALPSGAHLREKYPQQARWPLAALHVRRMAEAAARWRRLRAR